MTNKAGVIMVSPDTKKLLVVLNRATMTPPNVKFGLPKGHIEGTEPVNICASRELTEETGIIAKITDKDRRVNLSETTYFLIKASKCLDPKPIDTREIGESKWVPLTQIFNTDCNRGLRLIRDKLSNERGHLMNTLKSLRPRNIRIKSRDKQTHAMEKSTNASREWWEVYEAEADIC